MASCSLHVFPCTKQNSLLASGYSAEDSRQFTRLSASHCAPPSLWSTLSPVKRTQMIISCSTCSSTTRTSSTRGFSTYYDLLGIDENVGLSEIKSAYRQMARRYHPDVCASSHKEESTELFLQVREAYEILSDPGKRAHYDYKLLHSLCAQSKDKTGQGGGTLSSRWQFQLASLKHRRRAEGAESWGSKMRSRGTARSEM